MEGRLKATEHKNDNYGKYQMNQSKYNKLDIIDQEKAFFTQCPPEFKGSRALKDNNYLVEKNYKTHTVNTAIQEAVFTLDNVKFWYIKFV
jgi:hypothetical protein